jgi:hypothetical protein
VHALVALKAGHEAFNRNIEELKQNHSSIGRRFQKRDFRITESNPLLLNYGRLASERH